MGGIIGSLGRVASHGVWDPERNRVTMGDIHVAKPAKYFRDIFHAGTLGLIELQPKTAQRKLDAEVAALQPATTSLTAAPATPAEPEAYARERAMTAAQRAPGRASAVLTDEPDELELLARRRRLLGE